MLSDPAAIKALYTEREHGLPPGRNVFLEPILGAALAAAARRRGPPRPPQADAARLPRRADARPTSRSSQEIVDARDRLLAARRGVRPPPADAGDDPRGDPARRLRRRRRARGWSGCAACSAACWPRPPRRRPSCSPCVSSRVGGGSPVMGEVRGAAAARSTSCSTRRSPSTARKDDLEDRDDILSALILARFEDGEGMTDTDLRDQLMTLLLAGHETTATALAWTFDLLLRHPAAAAAPARLARGGRGRVPAGDDHRVAAPAAGRAARRPPPRQGAGRRRADAAGRDRRDAGDLARPHPRRRLSRALRLPARALPRGAAPTPTPGSPSAAASAAASAPPSPSSRCGSCCARSSPAASSARPTRRPSGSRRRNVTLSPRDGTRVVVTARHPARERDLVAA